MAEPALGTSQCHQAFGIAQSSFLPPLYRVHIVSCLAELKEPWIRNSESKFYV